MMPRTEEPWFDLGRPVLARLDSNWRDEAEATDRITLPAIRVYGLQRIGFVETRRHWLTRRMQLRLTPAALCSSRVNADRRDREAQA